MTAELRTSSPTPPQGTTPVPPVFSDMFAPKRAVIYLRVSTKRQASKGDAAEGFSIPAQRDANKRKAQSLGAMVAKEFVDRGESARSVKRPALQGMLDYIASHAVDYVIVHKIDRLARNRDDDSDIMRQLTAHGVTLVSTTENIDQSPNGLLMHGIMASIAEFYSQNLAAEVKKGMAKKAEFGGTPGKAPLGYMNIPRQTEDGRFVRTVVVDPDRGELMALAFQLYATGEWTLKGLADHLAGRGLTTRPTANLASKPINDKTLLRLFQNPYYKGVIAYGGVEHQGKHPRLVDDATWQKVQDIRASHRTGERTRKHPHWLRGIVFCGECSSRLIVIKARSSSGDYYPYFVCIGRHSKTTSCQMSAVLISEVEKKITEDYRHNTIPAELREPVLTMVTDRIRATGKDTERELAQLTTTSEQLERERTKLLQAHYADAIPLDTLKNEQHRISGQLADIDLRRESLSQDIASITECIDLALHLMTDAQATFSRLQPTEKRLLTQAFYERIFIGSDGHLGADVREPFKTLRSPGLQQNATDQVLIKISDNEKGAVATGYRSSKRSETEPQSLSRAVRLSTATLVAGTGFEPVTSGL